MVIALAAVIACGSEQGERAHPGDSALALATVGNGTKRGADPRELGAVRERLSNAAGGTDGRSYESRADVARAAIAGTVQAEGTPPDTTVVPTHDLVDCPRFTQPVYPSRKNGVGEAVVWLSGVASGRKDDAPRRVTVSMRDCQLSPRVQRAATGSTIIVNTRDAVMARFRFADVGPAGELRTIVSVNDAGQVVPTAQATRAPGIVAIRDDLHPWVRGYLAVTPHPYVAVTDADGAFRMEGVPAGKYTLVVWHERFGTTTRAVTVGNDGEVKVDVTLR